MNAAHALKLICVGAGRDGTLSVAEMIQYLFDRVGRGQRVMHEYKARELYQAFCNFRETNDNFHLDEIRSTIDDCPYDCIVGNGYAAILPQFAERCGKTATLLHLRRADRASAIASLKTNCELFPQAYRYYSKSSQAVVKRIAAFHFGEMTPEQWDRLSLEQKFAWYYDKTHALIASHQRLFAASVEVTTETINDEATRRFIAYAALGQDGILPPATWLNSHRLDIARLPTDRHLKMQWLIGRLNMQQLAYEDTYGLDYFLEKFIAWTGYQITGAIKEISPHDARTSDELKASLDTADRIVRNRLKDIEALRAMLAQQKII
jgi:hypothetical protein